MTDKEKTIKELKEALDSLDITNKYRLNLIRAIEYLQEESVGIFNNTSKKYPLTGKEIIVLRDDEIYYGKYIGGFHRCYVRAEIQLTDDTAQTYAIIDYLTKKDKWIYVEDLQNISDVQRTTKNWKEPVSEDLSDCINKLSKQFQEVSFAKLSRIAVRVAKWQKEQIIAKAVETTFNVSLPSGLYDKLCAKNCKEGDKLLVIKKDEL